MYTDAFQRLLEFIIERGKTVRYIIVTHAQLDHVANLEFVNNAFTGFDSKSPEEFFDYELIVSDHSPLQSNVAFRIPEREEHEIDGVRYRFHPTPGLTRYGDDLSIELPSDGLLFCGDFCQPQGPSYDQVDSVSPVPYFHNGDQAIESLSRLLEVDFDFLQTSHGMTLEEEEGRRGLSVTAEVLKRIDALAKELTSEHPWTEPETLAEWIFDTISHERNFDKGKAFWRKTARVVKGKTEFDMYDRPVIDYFVTKYRDA